MKGWKPLTYSIVWIRVTAAEYEREGGGKRVVVFEKAIMERGEGDN